MGVYKLYVLSRRYLWSLALYIGMFPIVMNKAFKNNA